MQKNASIRSNILLFAVFILTLIISCTNHYLELPTNIGNDKIDIEYEDITIESLNNNTVENLEKNLFVKDFKDSCLAFLQVTDAQKGKLLQVFNMNTQQYLDEYILTNDLLRIDSFGRINSLVAISRDTVWILQEQRVAQLIKGKLAWSCLINELSELQSKDIWINNIAKFPIYFDNISNKIYLPSNSYAYNADYDKRFYRVPVMASIDVRTKVIALEPVHYSKLYVEGYYGFWSNVYHSPLNDSISAVTFAVDPNIYLYNRHTQQVRTVAGKSQYQTAKAQALDTKYKDDRDKKKEHLALHFEYTKILHDQYRKLNYRFFYKAQPLKNADGMYNTVWDRALVLMIFDEDWQLLKELELGIKQYSPAFSYVTKEGLYINTNKPAQQTHKRGNAYFKLLKIKRHE